MVISPIVGLLPSQGEDDITLSQILAEFVTLPALVSPIVDEYAEGEIPTTEYHPLELPTDLLVTPAGPVDGVRSTRDLKVPAFPTRRGDQCSQYIRGVAPRRRKRRRNFDCSLQRQRCFSQEIKGIAFVSARMPRMCRSRALSTFIGSDTTPLHHFVRARRVRAVPSVSLHTIWR